MKKYTEIIRNIADLQVKKSALAKELNTLIDSRFPDNMTIKEKATDRKNNADKHAALDKAIAEKDAELYRVKIRIKLEENNAKLALAAEAIPVIVEILNKYNGKPLGPRTKEKIAGEMETKTGVSMYIRDNSYSGGYIDIYAKNFTLQIGTVYDNESKRYPGLLVNNKIQALSAEQLTPYHINKRFFDDTAAAAEEAIQAYDKIKTLKAELDAVAGAFNVYAVEGIERVYFPNSGFHNHII